MLQLRGRKRAERKKANLCLIGHSTRELAACSHRRTFQASRGVGKELRHSKVPGRLNRGPHELASASSFEHTTAVGMPRRLSQFVCIVRKSSQPFVFPPLGTETVSRSLLPDTMDTFRGPDVSDLVQSCVERVECGVWRSLVVVNEARKIIGQHHRRTDRRGSQFRPTDDAKNECFLKCVRRIAESPGEVPTTAAVSINISPSIHHLCSP